MSGSEPILAARVDSAAISMPDGELTPCAPAARVMVYQALPRWSRAHLDDPAWPAALLASAATIQKFWNSFHYLEAEKMIVIDKFGQVSWQQEKT